VRVRFQVKRVEGAWTWKPPKTKRSRRQIAIPAETAEALAVHRVKQMEERLRLGAAWADNDLVFPSRVGTPIMARNLYRAFKALLAKARLPRAVRFHDLRHTCATLLLAARVNPKVVSEMLGHASVAITLDIYSHVLPDMQQDAAATMGQMLYG
jgi:integrase